MQDTERRIVCCRSAQRVCELFLVRVGHRQPEDPMPVATCGQRVDQRLNRWRIITYEQPGRSLAGLRSRDCGGRFLPADLVTVVRDGLGCTLLVVLCRKPGQHLQGLMVAARTVEQGREFFDRAVLKKTDGFGTRPAKALLWVGARPIVAIPVLAMLERIGGQIELSRVRVPEGGEVGQVAQDVRVGHGFGDLSVVGGVSAQRRDRPRCAGRVRPCAHGCGGEHRSGADLEQHFATSDRQRVRTLLANSTGWRA